MTRAVDASTPFHRGELAVQARAGVLASAARVGGIIGDTIPPAFVAFLGQARSVAAGAADDTGRLWATFLVGEPGFVAASPDRLFVGARPAPGDALEGVLRPGGESRPPTAVGLTIIDLATRRRVRVNGAIVPDHDEGEADAAGFRIAVVQAYANCPKYIQSRVPPPGMHSSGRERHSELVAPEGSTLSEAQQAWLRQADTVFLASMGPGGGADASHRGGAPGFLSVDPQRVVIPDYAGNTMFNTLGNLAVDSRLGLVAPDFTTGRLLQVTGTATVDWRPEVAAALPGAERAIILTVERVREVPVALPAGWSAARSSQFNPVVAGPGALAASIR